MMASLQCLPLLHCDTPHWQIILTLEYYQHIQDITADPNCDLHVDQVRKHNINLHLNIAELQQNLKIEGIPESQ